MTALVMAGIVAPAASARSVARQDPCTDRSDKAMAVSFRLGRQRATGHYTLPRRKPHTLVVFAHGYGHTSYSWIAHMRRASRHPGVAAVAMDNRGIKISKDTNGDGLPESRGWNVMAGAQDSIAVSRILEARCRSIDRIVIFGVSMGGNTSGLAVALAGEQGLKKTDGSPLFDYWFDIEGAVNVVETYSEARALAPANDFAAQAVADMEAETGGPIEDDPAPYLERSVVRRIEDVAAAGLEGVVLVHGLDDGLVPYNQSREFAQLLASQEIDYEFFTVGRRSPESERETTASGYVGSQLSPDYTSPLSGHASEKSTTHVIMVTGFERLWSLIDDDLGFLGRAREVLVDGELGHFGTFVQ